MVVGQLSEVGRGAFNRLLEAGIIGGQPYALGGLYYSDRERFDVAIQDFWERDETLADVLGELVTAH